MESSYGNDRPEKFISFKSQNHFLKNYVAYYYIHYSCVPDFRTAFNYYPHYRNAITVYLNADLFFDDDTSSVKPGESEYMLFSRNYDRRIKVSIQGPFKKLGIAFEPLGVNRFVQAPLRTWADKTVNRFQLFDEEPLVAARKIFDQDVFDLEKSTEILDDLLIKRLHDFDDRIVSSSLGQMFESIDSLNISILAEKENISRKTLLRHFREHLNCSVKTYLNLIRFRKALNMYYENRNKISFAQLAVEHNYYDQPEFIKNFKKITGYSPRVFFEHLKKYGSQDTYWRT